MWVQGWDKFEALPFGHGLGLTGQGVAVIAVVYYAASEDPGVKLVFVGLLRRWMRERIFGQLEGRQGWQLGLRKWQVRDIQQPFGWVKRRADRIGGVFVRVRGREWMQ
jgi:hypothetical protein